jgi:site-specific DNA-methyltransferase (adenine-specific)
MNLTFNNSTGVACVNTGRKFIGIELDTGYFEVASNRISEALAKQD